MKKAVVLLSGGIDSTTALYYAKSKGFDIYALSIDYGQRHVKELECAEKIAKAVGVAEHISIKADISAWGGSALTDRKIDIPQGNIDRKDIPTTYVPARNMIFLSYAASYAEAIGAYDIFTGISEVDYSGYVDCRKEFIDSVENTMNLGTVSAVEHNKKMKIHTPFIFMKKSDEIQLGIKLGVNYADTWSCYKGREYPCGTCDSCLLRLKAFKDAGFDDPLKYKY